MASFLNLPNFLWKVENFTSVDRLISPAMLSIGLKWRLKFSRIVEDDEKMRLILDCLSTTQALPACLFKTETSLVDMHKLDDLYDDRDFLQTMKYRLNDKEWCIWTEEATTINEHMGKEKDICFSVVLAFSQVGSLLKSLQNVEKLNDFEDESLCINSLSEDFGRMFNVKEYSDFIIQRKEKTFYVHKAVLASRCRYFGDMPHKLKEVVDGSEYFEDIELDILELVLRYLYTGEMPKLPMESLRGVFRTAVEFGIESLKSKCFSLLFNIIMGSSEGNDAEGTSGSETEGKVKNDRTDVVKEESDEAREFGFLKEVFMTREWRLFHQEFPYDAQKMCEIYLSD